MVYHSIWHIIFLASCKYAHQLNKTTASYDGATLNEKGIIPKVKGGDCLTREAIGRFPCVDHPFKLLLSGRSYCWVVVGVVGLSVLAHVPTPPANSSSSHQGQKKYSLHSPMRVFFCLVFLTLMQGSSCSSSHRESFPVHSPYTPVGKEALSSSRTRFPFVSDSCSKLGSMFCHP